MEDTQKDAAVGELMSTKAARTKDMFLGVALVAVGLYSGISVLSTKATGFVDEQTMDHTTLPSIWGILMAVLSAVWLLQVLSEYRTVNKSLAALGADGKIRSVDQMVPELTGRLLLRMIIAIAAIIVYAVFFEELPFFLITGIFLFVMLLVFGRPFGWQVIILSIIGCAAFHVLFVTFLSLPL